MSVRYSISLIIVQSKTPLMMMMGVVRVRVVAEEVVFECASEMNQTLLVLYVIHRGHPGLSVRPKHPVLLLLQVLLQLQVVQGIGEVRTGTPIRGVKSGGVVRVVRLQLLLLIIHVC